MDETKVSASYTGNLMAKADVTALCKQAEAAATEFTYSETNRLGGSPSSITPRPGGSQVPSNRGCTPYGNTEVHPCFVISANCMSMSLTPLTEYLCLHYC